MVICEYCGKPFCIWLVLFFVLFSSNILFAQSQSVDFMIKGRGRIANKCLDVSGANPANGTPIIIWDCHGGDSQKWRFKSDGSIAGLANKCLDVSGANPANGTPIILYDCHGGNNQQWKRGIYPEGSGPFNKYPIIGLANKCLDASGADPVNGAQIILNDCNGSYTQKWDLKLSEKIAQFELLVAEGYKVDRNQKEWDSTELHPIVVKRDNPHLYGFIPLGGPTGSNKPSFLFSNAYEYVDWEWTPRTPYLLTHQYGALESEHFDLELPTSVGAPDTGSKKDMQFWYHRGLKLMTSVGAWIRQNYFLEIPGQYNIIGSRYFEAIAPSYTLFVRLDPQVMVIPVAIVTVTGGNLHYDFGQEAEALIDFMPSPLNLDNGTPEYTEDDFYIYASSKAKFPHPTAIGLPPDDIFGKCHTPIQFQSVGYWSIPYPTGWRPLGQQCPSHKYANWLPGYDEGIYQEIAKAYADQPPDVQEYIARVFGSKENGGLQPVLIRIGHMPVNCPSAYGHTGTDGIDISADYAAAAPDLLTKLEGNTIAHELGHLLGLDHLNEKGNLMQEFESSISYSNNLSESQCRQIYREASKWHAAYSTWLKTVKRWELNKRWK